MHYAIEKRGPIASLLSITRSTAISIYLLNWKFLRKVTYLGAYESDPFCQFPQDFPVKRRISRPEYTPIISNPEDEREKMVDYLLKRKHLTLDEKKFIYDFLRETGKEKWRYIDGYWGYYRISSTGFIESCRRHNLLNPSERKKAYKVLLSVNREAKGFSVHKLVAETFIPNPDGAISVVPKDGDYRHCDVRNLVWKPQVTSTKIDTKIETSEAA